MGAGRRGGVAIAAALAVVVLVEAFALRAETLGVVVVVALAVLGLIVVVVGADLVRVGIGATYLAAFTLTWNGWFVGPLRPGDALVPIALMCFAAGAPVTVFRTPPWWIKQLCLALVLGVVLIVLFPPDPAYLVQRVVLSATGQPVYRSNDSIATQNIGVAVKFIIAVGAIPIAFAASALLDRRALKRLGMLFCTGAALNGAVAFVDHTGVASIGHYLTHVPNLSARQLGFANHPNFLAAGLVLAIPFACWLLVSSARLEKWVGAVSLLSQLLGVYATGSRGGAVCAVGAVILSFALLPRTRPHLPAILLGAVAGAVAVAALFPSFGLAILRVTRLAGNPTTTGSDIVRAKVADQGMADFHYSPIHGIGLQASTDASQVYIQELAAGGLILFLAMSVYMIGAAWDAWRFVDRDPLAAAILASVIATLALNVFEADLTDRFYYVPEAILVAMIMLARRADADPPAVVAETPTPVGART